MNNTALLVAAGLLFLGLGWLAGSRTGGAASPEFVAALDAEVETLREENGRLRRILGERGPMLEGGPQLTGSDTTQASPTLRAAAGPKDELPKRTEFDLRTFDDPDKAFQALLAYAATMLGHGAEGHLALLDTLNATFAQKEGAQALQRLVGSEEALARYLYPLIRFAMNHDAQVADMTETVFKTMASEPARLEGVDDDMLQMFTEGVSFMLPGMVGEDRLETFRTHARAILETPKEDQPLSVQRERRHIQRALESWAPALSTEEALERLNDDGTSPEEALSLLRKLGPEQVGDLDLDALLGPLLQTDGYRVVSMIGRLKPDGATMSKLDQRLIQGVLNGSAPQNLVQYYLRYTGRHEFDRARTFLESGLQQATPEATGIFVMSALGLRPGPDAEWLTWVEQTYQIPGDVRLAIKRLRQEK